MIGYLSTIVDYKILLSQYDGWVDGLSLKNDNQNVFCWEFLIEKFEAIGKIYLYILSFPALRWYRSL